MHLCLAVSIYPSLHLSQIPCILIHRYLCFPPYGFSSVSMVMCIFRLLTRFAESNAVKWRQTQRSSELQRGNPVTFWLTWYLFSLCLYQLSLSSWVAFGSNFVPASVVVAVGLDVVVFGPVQRSTCSLWPAECLTSMGLNRLALQDITTSWMRNNFVCECLCLSVSVCVCVCWMEEANWLDIFGLMIQKRKMIQVVV